jgi:endonuclease/exonuclease/phosphatase (EEP) superfamily protein YafD
VLGWILTAGFFVIRHFSPGDDLVVPVWLFVVLGLFLTGWHAYHVCPYMPLFPKQAKSADVVDSQQQDRSTLRLVISNVEKENDQYELWMQKIEAADPDILVALEIDERWVHSIDRLLVRYPYRVVQPQDNWYGMMMLSRLPFVSHELRFLVQDDVPSIDALVRLRDQTLVRVVAVHPRPPEPIRGNDAVARDAELTFWGQELADERRPVLICGDLNDVAWSHTTRLFLRTSRLLDPRRGRGLFNSFNAKFFFLRFPVDHVFISPHFTVSGIQRLPFVGSDHFPIQIDLCFQPEQRSDENVLETQESDDDEANERIERAVKDPKMDGEAIETLRTSP